MVWTNQFLHLIFHWWAPGCFQVFAAERELFWTLLYMFPVAPTQGFLGCELRGGVLLDHRVNKYSTSIAVADSFLKWLYEFALVHFHTCSTLLPTLDIGCFCLFFFCQWNGYKMGSLGSWFLCHQTLMSSISTWVYWHVCFCKLYLLPIFLWGSWH